MKNKTFKEKIIVLSIILAAIFTLQIIGKKIIYPFSVKVSFNDVCASYIEKDKPSVVIDSNNTRILFLDDKHKILHVEHLNDGSYINKAINITSDGEYFYFTGDKLERHSLTVAYTRVVRYDLNGKNPKVIYQIKPFSELVTTSITDIEVDEKFIYVADVQYDKDNRNYPVSVIRIPKDSENADTTDLETILTSNDINLPYDVQYDVKTGNAYFFDYFGALYRYSDEKIERIYLDGKMGRTLDVLNDGSIIWADPKNYKLYLDDEILYDEVYVTNVTKANDLVSSTDKLNDSVLVYDMLTNKKDRIYSLDYRVSYYLLILIRFISVIYLFIFIIYNVYKSINNIYKEKSAKFTKLIIIASGCIIAIVISTFYSRQIRKVRVSEIQSKVTSLAKFFAEVTDIKETARIIDFANDKLINGIDSELDDDILSYDKFYGSYTKNVDNNGFFISIYKKIGDRFYLAYDSGYRYQVGISEVLTTANLLKNDFVLLSNAPIYDGEKESGMVTVSESLLVFEKQVLADIFELSMELITIFAVLFTLISEGIILCKSFKKRQLMMKKNIIAPEIATIRPLNFFFSLLTNFDYVILVLIAKDMLSTAHIEGVPIDVLIALPPFLAGIGVFIGSFIFSAISSKVTIKKLSITAIIFMCVFQFFMIPSIIFNNYYLFCLCKFLVCVCNGVVYSTVTTMPYRASKEVEQNNALQDKSLGGISSSIMGGLIGGFVAQIFGNVFVYVVNVIAYVPVIIIMMIVLPKNCIYTKGINEVKNDKYLPKLVKFIFSPIMLIYMLLFLLPLITISGYKNYMFPLYSSELNLPKMYISNFCVFASTLIVVISYRLRDISKKYGYYKVSIVAMIFMGLAFFAFSLNSTIYWAVIVLFINAMIDKMLIVSKDIFWSRQAKAVGIDVVKSANVISTISKFMYSLKESILSLFIVLAGNKACVLLGISCLIATTLFYIFTRNTPISSEN